MAAACPSCQAELPPLSTTSPRRNHSPTYDALVAAGPRLGPLQQVHTRIITSGLHRARSLHTKLLTLACAAGAIHYTWRILHSVPNPDSFLFVSLIRASSKSHLPTHTLLFYRRLLSIHQLQLSSYTFTPVIKSCADLRAKRIGRSIHGHVIVNGFAPDSFVQAALVGFYAKCDEMACAQMVFDRMAERSVVAWNTLISGYEQNGLAEEAVRVFGGMREGGVVPDSATLVGLLAACSQLGRLDLGQWVRDYIGAKGMEMDVVLGTSLINMYSRCGAVWKAREVFDELEGKNVVTWTAMISGYGMHGYGSEALALFQKMRYDGPGPNHVTFVAVLSSCAHAGFVVEGREVFSSMKRDYCLVPREEHHVCMVDMLGRAGLFGEADWFIRELIPGEPGPAVWTALLGACKMHKNFKLGVEVAERLLTLEPDNPGHYVLLSNIYALAGRMDRVEMVRNSMIRRRLKKQTGYSLIEVDQVSHVFRMGDKSHPRAAEIYRYLEELIRKVREAGYAPETESVLHELEEEEREYAVRFHSEKLAVAFGMLSTAEGTVIRIVKNLRMCSDCHLAIKFISAVTTREIIIRDKLRFHHFREGFCSCQDYW